MKLRVRGVHIRKAFSTEANKGSKKPINDISLEFMDTESNLLQNCILHGNNGCGKSFVLQSIATSWGSSISSSSGRGCSLQSELIRVDFALGSEIASVHIRNGVVDRSAALARVSEVSEGRMVGGVLLYGSNRSVLSHQYLVGGGSLPFGVQNVLPILYDMHVWDVRDSVILVDDWDLGLDDVSIVEFYNHMVRHCHSRGNQLILSCCRGDYSFARNFVEIRGSGGGVISEALALLNRVGK